MLKQQLHDQWLVYPVGDLSDVPEHINLGKLEAGIPATVPGCVHTDLLAAKLIPDPYLDRNEDAVQWVSKIDWQYRCTFDAEADMLASPHMELVCEGLDTIATVELNGQPLGQTANMHHPHEFDAKAALQDGKNELTVTFSSALAYAYAMEKQHGPLPHVELHPFNFIRKMACNFGWDWGPRLVTCGVWKPIYLRGWSRGIIKSVRPLVTQADEQQATVTVHIALQRDGDAALDIGTSIYDPAGKRLACDVNAEAAQDAITLTLQVDKPQLWWPIGHGDQPLYELKVKHKSSQGDTLQTWSHRIGLRTTQLDTSADDIGSKFTIKVNGKPIFCRGANWIPDDCFVTRVTPERYRQRITQGIDANMNMLRVWGGGIYESDDFYDICDELGVMVWQDFLFACAAYPEEPPFDELVEAEARANITRLSRHPSLVLWNGCNENIWGYFDWGWKDALPEGRTWGLGYYLDLLPKLVSELDPTRPYWPGSPYSGSMDIHPNDDHHGNKHIWDAWNQKDYTICRDYTPRFCSEFGHQAPPTFATLARVISADQRSINSPTMLAHQRANDGQQKLMARLREHFPEPTNLDDWLYMTQVNQARALQVGVEWQRSRQSTCMGSLYWQLNDCWPVCSWAAVDGDGRRKPLWYATRRFFAPRLLTIQPNAEGRLTLFAINDSDKPWRDAVSISRMDMSGQRLAQNNVELIVEPRTNKTVLELVPTLTNAGDISGEYVVAQPAASNSALAPWFFDVDKNMMYPQPQFISSLESSASTHQLTIAAQTLLRDLCIFVDRLDPAATVSDQLVTLLPGMEHTFEITSDLPLDEAALTSVPVLQCVNRFGKNRK